MACVAFVSFRFGATDGVSVVARTWMEAFAAMGFEVRTVAGEPPADRVVGGLALDADAPPTDAEVAGALADADLVVVENLATIPLHVEASLAVGRVLAGRPAILHHHDPPWHRARFAHVTELPLDDPAWRHVAIQEVTAAELAERGIGATVIHNAFAPLGPGDRAGVRARLGVGDGDRLVVHPVRAIERKNVPAALALAEALGATYWLPGPAEEGYGPTLERLLAGAGARVRRDACPERADLYAAADLVAFPSTWEGFGNPPIEAALAHRPAAVGDYPFAGVLARLGFRFLDPADPAAADAWLAHPDEGWLAANEALARRHFSIEAMRERLARLVADAGWCP